MGAGGQVIGAGARRITRGRTWASVWVKSSWADEWTWLPYVRAIEAEEAAPPNVGSAQFSNWFGRIKREDSSVWDIYSPVSLLGTYIQILAHPSDWGANAWPVWVGVVEDEQGRTHNVPETLMSTNILTGTASAVSGWPQGEQRFTALGLEHVMDRIPILGSYTDAGCIQRDLVFNRRDRVGVTLMGNRSAALDEAGAYHFSGDGELWTNYDILVYLIKRYLNSADPAAPVWYIEGCEEALSSIVDRYALNGLSVFEAFNKLIDRKRGFGWRIVTWAEAGAPVVIYVYSLLDVATQWMPANPDPVLVNMDGVDDATLVINFDNRPRYHELVVRGGPVSVCGTWDVEVGNLEAGWSPELEAEYVADTDENRSAARYSDVYSRIRVPADWDGNLLDGPALPLVLADCSLDWTEMAPLFIHARRFAPIIPYPEADQEAGAEGVEWRNMAALIPVDDVWNFIEKIGTGENAEGTPAHVRPNDSELGVIVKSRVNHILAGADWAGDSDIDPEYSYLDLALTAMLETDQELHVTLMLPSPALGELVRRKVIELPDAVMWIVLPGTAYDIQDGALLEEVELRVVRDDRAMLYMAADFAQLWFGRPRASVTLEVQNVIPVHPVGTMIAGFVGHTMCPVGTAVTRRRWDFTRNRMTVQTNYEEMDATLSGQMRAPARELGPAPMVGTAEYYATRPPMVGTADYYAGRRPSEGTADWWASRGL